MTVRTVEGVEQVGALRAPFKKVLYLKQDYPDNYTDASFLSDLQRNGQLCSDHL